MDMERVFRQLELDLADTPEAKAIIKRKHAAEDWKRWKLVFILWGLCGILALARMLDLI